MTTSGTPGQEKERRIERDDETRRLLREIRDAQRYRYLFAAGIVGVG
jgi:hypothetical protein